MRIFAFIALLSLVACAPTSESGRAPWTKGAMVTAANPHAAAAAAEILALGGHAVDAAIAAHVVLGLVEPQSSGLGGGGFMLVYDRARSELSVFDGRETAPAAATADLFVVNGKPLGFLDAWQSGMSVGVPGAVAMYRLAHDEHGALAWQDLFAPAIRLATDGFAVSPRLARMLQAMGKPTRLDDNPATAAYFFPGGEPLRAGDLLRNPAYANTLTRIAEEGPRAFYTGELAAEIAAAAQAPPNGGELTVQDIGAYAAVRREAVCGAFRTLQICGAPPPSSGAAQILIAGLYDELGGGVQDRNGRISAFVDAQRLGYADRDHYFADPAFVDVPVEALTDPAYIRLRATERFAPDESPTHGVPFAASAVNQPARGADTTAEIGGTTHLSIVDRYGNAVSMTASIEGAFGSSRWAAGFLLNNEMTDFARVPVVDGRAAANAAAPGKRPRSSMSPLMVFDDDGELLMVTGSPGGHAILAYVAKTVIGVLDWDMTAQQAVDYPNVFARGQSVNVEQGSPEGERITAELEALGYTVRKPRSENSGVHMIVVREDGLEGAADKRREGVVRTQGTR